RARAGHDLAGVEADFLGREAKIVEPVEQMIDFGAPQQCLGWNAAPVEADAAQVLALDDRRLHPQLRRPDSRDVTPRPTADNYQTEGSFRHNLKLHRHRRADERSVIRRHPPEVLRRNALRFSALRALRPTAASSAGLRRVS